jgi:hypothetical protein
MPTTISCAVRRAFREAESAGNGKLDEKEKPLTQDRYFTQKWGMPPDRSG